MSQIAGETCRSVDGKTVKRKWKMTREECLKFLDQLVKNSRALGEAAIEVSTMARSAAAKISLPLKR